EGAVQDSGNRATVFPGRLALAESPRIADRRTEYAPVGQSSPSLPQYGHSDQEDLRTPRLDATNLPVTAPVLRQGRRTLPYRCVSGVRMHQPMADSPIGCLKLGTHPRHGERETEK